MVMADMPTAEDAAAGMIFSGEAGALFDRMLAAIGREPRDHLSRLLLADPPAGRAGSTRRASRMLAEIARHHIGLAAPRALLLFGDICAQAPCSARRSPAARGRWHEIETPSGPGQDFGNHQAAKSC